MSELTDKVRKMLSQAQVFVTDTPFEAVSRARQALSIVDTALREPTLAEADQRALVGLRNLAASRVEKYEARLASWLAESEARAERYTAHERLVLAHPMRAKV